MLKRLLKKKGKIFKKSIYLVLLGIFLIFTLFPIYWLINTSFMMEEHFPPLFIPPSFNLDNFKAMLGGAGEGYGGLKIILDSAIISIFSTLLSVFLGSLAAYGFSRFKKHPIGNKNILFWILTTRMLPPVAIVVPLFLLFKRLYLIDTYQGLIITYLIFNLPFVIWLMKKFFDDVPIELEEAAIIDGCSRFRVFYAISIPLVKPGIVAVTLFSWVFSWNEFLFALLLTRTVVRPFPPMIPLMAATDNIRWSWIAALSVIAAIPVIGVIILLRKYLVRGLSLGAIKQ